MVLNNNMVIIKDFKNKFNKNIIIEHKFIRIGFYLKPTIEELEFLNHYFKLELIEDKDDDCGWQYWLNIV